jgi:hypothetical protein
MHLVFDDEGKIASVRNFWDRLDFMTHACHSAVSRAAPD